MNKNAYITIDSKHYLRAAKNFLDGEGFVTPASYPFKGVKGLTTMAKWPVGYSFFIASCSYLTNSSILWSSKIVNLFFFGLTLLLLRKLFGSETWFIALAFFGFTAINIYSYSWSEGAFLFTTCWFSFILIRWEHLQLNWLQLGVCLSLSFLFRYAAIIYFCQVALIVFMLVLKKKRNALTPHLIGLGIASIVAGGYLYQNYTQTGHITGMNRLEVEGTENYFIMMLKGITNELSVIGNYNFKGSSILLFVGSAIAQLILMIWMFTKRSLFIKTNQQNERDRAGFIFFSVGMFYFIGISLLRAISTFDALDFRLLAPTSIPILLALLIWTSNPLRSGFFEKVKWPIVAFFVVSLLMNLPKTYILELFGIY